MHVQDLTRNQLIELKEQYLTEHLLEVEGREPSYAELADADNIVDDWLVFDEYADTIFSSDDFADTTE